MQINTIRPKYCTPEKVQIMYSNAPKQFILSRDGLLYLKNGNTIIHRYLDDPIRASMPYSEHPCSAEHASHLLKYGEIYVKFTSERSMTKNYSSGKYSLAFVYCYKNSEDKTILAEISLEDLLNTEVSKEKAELLTREQLKDFLYTVSSLKAKCIVHSYKGCMYLRSSNDSLMLDSAFLDLSDEGIAELSRGTFLTHTGYLKSQPYLITISDNQIEVFSLLITYIGHEKFGVITRSFKIDESKIQGIIGERRQIPTYPYEPNF